MFIVTWAGSATEDDFYCLLKQLNAIGPGPVTPMDLYIEATLSLENTPENRERLTATLNAACPGADVSIT